MKTFKHLNVCLILLTTFPLFGQTQFSTTDYQQFLTNNQDISTQTLLNNYDPGYDYFKGVNPPLSVDSVIFGDSVSIKYNLTVDEKSLLEENQFMVTERLSFNNFGHALGDIFHKDLPLFFTTDILLNALHVSYDDLLVDIEIAILEPELKNLLDQMTQNIPALITEYGDSSDFDNPLSDVDLYVTMAKSLLDSSLGTPQKASMSDCRKLWDAIASEQMTSLPLFSDRARKLDFSQFKVRGHYTEKYWDSNTSTFKTLGSYFKCMMWLGRMDFYFTLPPSSPEEPPWTKEEIKRMNLGGILLNALVDKANMRKTLNNIDNIITLFVGECDNLTPAELNTVLGDLGIHSVTALLDDSLYNAYQNRLKTWPQAGQQILSSFMLMDPFSATPDTLPVSFKLLGQRYIIDSYILGNVVFPNIIYQNQKIWRSMPNPLDALFCLGNENALHLLTDELNTYHYGTQLTGLNYLVDSHDQSFWDQSLYNSWLQAIRCLNPEEDRTGLPTFMKTAAWRQEKMNTQLASWAQLRHDNLLYAKQSYTGGAVCSFPHTYVEPYPDFFRQIAQFAKNANQFISTFSLNPKYFQRINSYLTRLDSISTQLAILADKELQTVPFSEDEKSWLQEMLFEQGGVCVGPPYTGWFTELFYYSTKATENDFIIADVHTQPTDEFGAVVGRVLHVGTGKINLGVFIAPSPSSAYQNMAYVGPVMSYYEKITENFKRMTDDEWSKNVYDGSMPTRPDWTHIYLADQNGNKQTQGAEIPSIQYSGTDPFNPKPDDYTLLINYPNPFNPATTINYHLPTQDHVRLSIYNTMGQHLITLVEGNKSSGLHTLDWHGETQTGKQAASGIYILKLQTSRQQLSRKISLLR